MQWTTPIETEYVRCLSCVRCACDRRMYHSHPQKELARWMNGISVDRLNLTRLGSYGGRRSSRCAQVERKLSIINSFLSPPLSLSLGLSCSRTNIKLFWLHFFNLSAPETKLYNWFETQEVSCELTRKSLSTNFTNLKCCNQYLSNFSLTNVFWVYIFLGFVFRSH